MERPLITEKQNVRASKGQLQVFYTHVGELSKVLVKCDYGCVFSHRSRGDQAVHEMDLLFSIAIQCIEVNHGVPDFNSGAGNESGER